MALSFALAQLPVQARAGAPENCASLPASDVVVNVKDKGAVGDGRADDTAAIQAAIDAVAGTRGTVLVPDGVYMVNAVEKNLNLKSDMTLKLAGGAVLKAIPNDETHYAVLTISGVSNVWVTGARSKASATNIAASRANGAWASVSKTARRTSPSPD